MHSTNIIRVVSKSICSVSCSAWHTRCCHPTIHPPPSISFVNHAKCLLVYEKGKSCTRWVRSSVSRHQSGGLVRILRLSLNLPGIKVNEITVKPVAVIIQQVVSLHTEARDACLEIFEQRSHSFNASL